MSYIAKVIVDVASNQTNQAYDYLVPASLEETLTIGYRVRVPFGNRKVQGFVIDVLSKDDVSDRIKEIENVIDMEPVLNTELVELGMYLQKTTHSFLISCFKTMLPSLLRASYEKVVRLVDKTNRPALFAKKDIINFDAIVDSNELKELMTLKKEGRVIVEYLVKNQAHHKTVRLFKPMIPAFNWIIRKNASNQLLLQQIFLTSNSLSSSELTQKGVHSATLKKAVENGWLLEESQRVWRDPFDGQEFTQTQGRTLLPSQQEVFLPMKESVMKNQDRVYLLEGVTGSGKTEIYLQLIETAIKMGKSALLLVPEIALTPQMVTQFKQRFGKRVAVLHSGLSKGERFDEWTKIAEKQADIIVGARSSVFAPLENLGIIIIDEEHETTYKQMDGVRYHARDIAIWRSHYHHCPVVLGSATPSLESRARAQKGVYEHLLLTDRVNKQPLPQVTLVDMTQEKRQGVTHSLSTILQEAITDRLNKKEQVILMLNKRGYSSFVMCRDCGYVMECPNCDISLTLHMDTKMMKCHYCDHQERIPSRCPKCASQKIRYFGTGTQKVEEELNELFPHANIIRMDMDTTSRKGQHEKLLRQFGNQEADILLGTQMIAKGLDFPNVTLVGVINADTALHLPDFRANEKTFQLLTQVAGRAGRSDKVGEVIIQSYNIDHYVLSLAKEHDYTTFYQREMTMRRLGKYPPYFFTTSITVSSGDESKAIRAVYQVKQMIETLNMSSVILLGPSAKAIARINNKYYFQLLLKYKKKETIQQTLDEIMLLSQELSKEKIYVSIDNEPMNFI